jgi:hypothetical protein
MDAYVSKPYSLTELRQVLDRVFSPASGHTMPIAGDMPKRE